MWGYFAADFWMFGQRGGNPLPLNFFIFESLWCFINQLLSHNEFYCKSTPFKRMNENALMQ